MKKTLIYPPDHPPSRGAYSPGIRLELGAATLVLITGQLAVDAENRVIAPLDAAEQRSTSSAGSAPSSRPPAWASATW